MFLREKQSNLMFGLKHEFISSYIARREAYSCGQQENAGSTINKSGKRNCDARIVMDSDDANRDWRDSSSAEPAHHVHEPCRCTPRLGRNHIEDGSEDV